MNLPELSIVVPVFNEEASIPRYLAEVVPVLEGITADWEIVFVNDGSRDGTLAAIRTANEHDPRVRGVDFSRNFGKEVALSAGLDHAVGRAVVPMDVDLQDPPALIVEMVAKWREGYDVVLAQRIDRSSDSFLKRTTAGAFYGLMRRLSYTDIPAEVGDYRLVDASVVAALRSYPERERFMKGIFASVGYRTTTLSYTRAPRAEGETKFNGRKLFKLALEGIVSFSTVPLKIWTYVGIIAAFAALIYAVYIVSVTLITGIDIPGYASLLTISLLFNGLIMVGLGIQGEYIARIFIEVKARPLYIVRERIGGEDLPAPERTGGRR